MNEVTMTWKGLCPLIMHNNVSANPRSIEAKTMKSLTSKRNKTDEDHEEIGRLEWESGLYLYDGDLVIPERVVWATMYGAAKKNRNGVKVKSGLFLNELNYPLSHNGKKWKVDKDETFPRESLNPVYNSGEFIYGSIVKVSAARVYRTRPIFNPPWSIDNIVFEYDPSILNEREIIQIAEVAGKIVGLCEQRPQMGRFKVEVVK